MFPTIFSINFLPLSKQKLLWTSIKNTKQKNNKCVTRWHLEARYPDTDLLLSISSYQTENKNIGDAVVLLQTCILCNILFQQIVGWKQNLQANLIEKKHL